MPWVVTTRPVEMVKVLWTRWQRLTRLRIALVGKEDVVRQGTGEYSSPKTWIRVVHASEVIETEEPPVNAIRKKDPSIVVGMNMVDEETGGGCLCFCRDSGAYPGRAVR